jgi:hypothetical protein
MIIGVEDGDVTISASDADLSFVENIDIVDGSMFAFNSSTGISFNRFPFRREIYLQNRSSNTDIHYAIQAYPSMFFTASPAFGTVAKGSTASITVIFTPKPHVLRRSCEISGFLRLRSQSGYSLGR